MPPILLMMIKMIMTMMTLCFVVAVLTLTTGDMSVSRDGMHLTSDVSVLSGPMATRGLWSIATSPSACRIRRVERRLLTQ